MLRPGLTPSRSRRPIIKAGPRRRAHLVLSRTRRPRWRLPRRWMVRNCKTRQISPSKPVPRLRPRPLPLPRSISMPIPLLARSISGKTCRPRGRSAGLNLRWGATHSRQLRPQFLRQQSSPITIPADPHALAVSFRSLSFDSTSTGRIRDAFEISLLGPDGKTLVPTIATGRDAFFNLGETSPAARAQGVASTTTQGITTVYLDISQVPPGTQAEGFRIARSPSDWRWRKFPPIAKSQLFRWREDLKLCRGADFLLPSVASSRPITRILVIFATRRTFPDCVRPTMGVGSSPYDVD